MSLTVVPFVVPSSEWNDTPLLCPYNRSLLLMHIPLNCKQNDFYTGLIFRPWLSPQAASLMWFWISPVVRYLLYDTSIACSRYRLPRYIVAIKLPRDGGSVVSIDDIIASNSIWTRKRTRIISVCPLYLSGASILYRLSVRTLQRI